MLYYTSEFFTTEAIASLLKRFLQHTSPNYNHDLPQTRCMRACCLAMRSSQMHLGFYFLSPQARNGCGRCATAFPLPARRVNGKPFTK